jgi:hypothetical protein
VRTAPTPRHRCLHILSIARDGTLSEPHGPAVFTPFGVPGNAHPQGIAAVPRAGGDDDGGSRRDPARATGPRAPTVLRGRYFGVLTARSTTALTKRSSSASRENQRR